MCCDLLSVANQKTKSVLSPKGNSDCGAARLFAKLYRRGSNSPNGSKLMLSWAIVFEGKIGWLPMAFWASFVWINIPLQKWLKYTKSHQLPHFQHTSAKALFSAKASTRLELWGATGFSKDTTQTSRPGCVVGCTDLPPYYLGFLSKLGCFMWLGVYPSCLIYIKIVCPFTWRF